MQALENSSFILFQENIYPQAEHEIFQGHGLSVFPSKIADSYHDIIQAKFLRIVIYAITFTDTRQQLTTTKEKKDMP